MTEPNCNNSLTANASKDNSQSHFMGLLIIAIIISCLFLMCLINSINSSHDAIDAATTNIYNQKGMGSHNAERK